MPNSSALHQETVPYDVKLNGQKYLLVPNSYFEYPVVESIARPGATHGGDPTAFHSDEPAWAWWSQTLWQGDNVNDWKGDGGFKMGYGMDESNDGQVLAAPKLTQVQAVAGASTGFMMLPSPDKSVAIAIDKAQKHSWTSADGTTWTDRGSIGTTGTATSWCYYKGALCVGSSDGTLRTTSDQGTTWAAFTGITAPNANPVYVLGTYKGKLYLSWGASSANVNGILYTWDGTTLSNIITLDGLPIQGQPGTGVMFIIAQGTPAHLYMVQQDQLIELLQWPSDFVPQSCIFTDTLYVTGGALSSSGGYTGEIWRLNSNGLEFHYSFPQVHGTGVDYQIYDSYNAGGLLWFGYNKGAGVGIYDPTLDLYKMPQLGHYLGSRTNAAFSGAGQVTGLLLWKGQALVGIWGQGIYQGSGFGNFQVTSSKFGSTSKRINKMWGLCEVTSTVLTSGQSILVEYSIDDGTTWTTLGTHNTVGNTKAFLAFPNNYKSPVLQFRATGTSNNATLALIDLSFSFIQSSSNPKRRWKMIIGLQGSTDIPMRYRDNSNFERSAVTMKGELDALWNSRFDFEDITGTTYHVMMPAIGVQVEQPVRKYDSGDQATIKDFKALYHLQLVEV